MSLLIQISLKFEIRTAEDVVATRGTDAAHEKYFSVCIKAAAFSL